MMELVISMIEYILLWIVCSIICFVGLFHYFQKKYSTIANEEYYKDMIFCFVMSLFGPFTLVSFIIFKLMNK